MVKRHADYVGSFPLLIEINQKSNMKLKLSGHCRAQICATWGWDLCFLNLEQIDYENDQSTINNSWFRFFSIPFFLLHTPNEEKLPV